MGQRFSKQFYPDLPQPRRRYSELRSRPSQLEQRYSFHHDTKVHDEIAEPYTRHERQSPKRRRSHAYKDTPSSHSLRDGTRDSRTFVGGTKSSVSKPTSNHTNRRTHHDHDHKHHQHRTHGELQHNLAISDQNQDSACYVSDPPPYSSHTPIPPATQQCPVCASTRSVTHFPTRLPTSACTHEAVVCKRCLRRWLAAQFETKPWNELNCPICPSVLESRDIREFASKEMFQRYEHQATKAEFDIIPGWTWCISKDCLAGQIHDARKVKFRCRTCQHRQCIKCGVKWHKSETCKEYQHRATQRAQRRNEDVASQALIRETTKQCPSCARPIEKIDGCDHMTCVKCKHQFCWMCLATYSSKKGVIRVQHEAGCTSLY
ncbi:hypothetical protein DE146DRAFT_429705 [Phaeosphaeria sp. MPI-PUGE-AT-0046c]|nr:hypothetical protein DE146DRAFT_429705 [Phaeosphaeria sp. MPI-PUGE-AT-0046c]